MINTLLGKIFGTKNEREVKRLQPRVGAINAFEPEMQKLSDDQLRGKTAEFRARIQERLSSIVDEPEADADGPVSWYLCSNPPTYRSVPQNSRRRTERAAHSHCSLHALH